MGAQLIKEVASKTNDVAGDGTTTATVLAQAMVHEGMKNLEAGANPIILRKGMKKATDVAVEAIAKMSSKVKDKDQIAKVAAISAGDVYKRQGVVLGRFNGRSADQSGTKYKLQQETENETGKILT